MEKVINLNELGERISSKIISLFGENANPVPSIEKKRRGYVKEIEEKSKAGFYAAVYMYFRSIIGLFGNLQVLNFLRNAKEVSIIDLGCGNGRTLYTFYMFLTELGIKVNKVVGIDIYPLYFENVPQEVKDIIEFREGNILEMNMEEIKEFNMIYSYIPFHSEIINSRLPERFMIDIMKHSKPNTLIMMPGFPSMHEIMDWNQDVRFNGKFADFGKEQETLRMRAFVKLSLP